MSNNASHPDSKLHVLMAIQAGGIFGNSHISRAKIIAQALQQDFNANVTFWIESPDLLVRNQLVQLGYDVIQQNWSLPETVRRGHYNRLVLDFSTSVTPSLIGMIKTLNEAMPIIVVDNTGQGALQADTVVFPNVHVDVDEWSKEFKGQLYHGLDYVVFGELFHKEMSATLSPDAMASALKAAQQPAKKTSLLVSVGSADAEQLSEVVIDYIKKLEFDHIDFIVPPMYPNPEAIEKIATRCLSPITLHWQIRGLRSMIKPETKMAISGFGISAYELAYSGVPMLLFAKNEEQLEHVERFCSYGIGINMGLASDLSEPVVMDHIRNLNENTALQQEMTDRGRHLFKNNGPEHIAKLIMEASQQQAAVQPPVEISDNLAD